MALSVAPGGAQVVINELHYHPQDPNGNAEFVELHNPGAAPVDISGWTLSGFAANTFTFPGGSSITAGGYVVVANDAVLLQSLTGFLTPYQWATGNLSNGGETVTLTDGGAVEVDSVSYDDAPPWPAAPDGNGPSLELINPEFDNSSPLVWGASNVEHGTPGAQNSIFSESPVVLSESPARLSVVDTLPTIVVNFSEPVQNVTAGDLSVNGVAATNVTGSGAGPYQFSGFAAPATAPIMVVLAAGAIQDLDTNAFGGTGWFYPNVVINELHYHPADPNGDAEFIELINAGTIPADISGWLLDFGPVPFQFPAGTMLAAADVTVVAADPVLLQTLTGFLAPFQWVAGALSNGGERVTLSISPGLEADRVDYGDRNSPPWPAAPDGDGPSLELIHPSLDNTLPLAWKASTGANGTPGAMNSVFDPGPIVIAESPARGSLIGAGLTQVSVTFHKDVTGVAAGDLIIDGVPAIGVTGSGAGPYVFTVTAPTSDQVAVSFGPGGIQDLALNPFSGDSWQYTLALPEVVINEIHYHPADSAVGPGEDPERLQFLELYNRGTSTVDLTAWRLTDGVTFEFPVGSSIAADEYVLVAKDGAFLSATIGTIPGGTQVFDWDEGDLDNGGETVRLDDPFANTIDRVEYNDEGAWPDSPDGTGPSLELINPRLLNEFALSWEASSTTNGTPGAPNSAFNINPAPVIAEVAHDPPIPAGGASVTVTARAFDASPFPVSSVQVCHRQDQSPTVGYVCEVMRDDGLSGDGAASDGIYGKILAGLANGQRMDFAIAASSGGGLTVSPRGHDCGLVPGTANCAAASPSQVYLVKFSDAGIPTDFPSYHLITTQVTRDAQITHDRTEYDGTVVHCQPGGSCEIHYNVLARYRGQTSLFKHPHSYAIRILDAPVQSEMGFPITDLLLLGQQPYRQELGYGLFEGAGHPTPHRQFVRVVRDPVPHEGLENHVYTNVERVDEDFMRSQGGAITPLRFPDRCSVSNTVCTRNLDCLPGESCVNTDQGNVYRGREDGDLRWEGPGPPAPHPGPYQLDAVGENGYQKITNEDADVWTDLIGLADALTCATDDGTVCVEDTYGGVYESILPNYMDVQRAAAWFAMHMLLVNLEGGLWRDTGDDYFVAFQPDFDHATFIPWDMDALFANDDNGVDATVWRTNVPATRRFLRHDGFAGYFVGEICRLLDYGFTQAEMDAAIDALPDVLFSQPEPEPPQGNGPQDKAGLKAWVAGRRAGVLNEISTQTTLTGVPASPYTDPNPVIALSGSLNQCGGRRVLVNGVEATYYKVANPLGTGANWSSNFTLVPGANNILVETVDHDGVVIDSASGFVVYSPPGSGGGPVGLKVTGPSRMVNTKTHTVRVEIVDSLGNTYWQAWTDTGSVSARRVSDLTPVPITVTVFETYPGGVGAGGPSSPDQIRVYNGLGSVSYTINNPASVAGQDLEITVLLAGFSASMVVTALDATTPGLFTELSGTLSGADLDWDPSDGVIHLTGNVDVGSNTLTIHPGTLIMADGGPYGDGVAILVDGGSVNAVGTEADPIFFFPTNGPSAMTLAQQVASNPAAWRGIDHQGAGTSTYHQVFLTGAGNGVLHNHPRPVILGGFGSHNLDISDCVFADNGGKIVHGGGSGTYTVARSLISRAGIGLEAIGDNHNLLIEDCWFTRVGRSPIAYGVDGDVLHLDNSTGTQLVRRTILADGGDDMIDHFGSFPVIEDSIIWDGPDKTVSLTGGGITFDNVLAFGTPQGISAGSGSVVLRNTTIHTGSRSMRSSGVVSVDESILTTNAGDNFSIGSCSGNVNYTLGSTTNHLSCGVGNLSGNPQFENPAARDYRPKATAPAASAGPTGGRIGWLGFPESAPCTSDNDCEDFVACTTNTCEVGACVFVPISGCLPCTTNGDCDDANPCTVDVCNTGFCSNAPGNDGASCDDGLACTDDDTCQAGTCSGTESCPVGQECGPAGSCIIGLTFAFQDDDVSYAGTHDTYIREADPNVTHGTLADTCFGSAGPIPCDFFEWDAGDPTPFQNIGLLRFDDIVGPNRISQGTLINSATLTLVISDPAGAGAAIRPVTVDWDEATATWNNFGGDPGVQPDEYGIQIATAPTAVGTHVLDITSTVQGWINNPATNFGLVFLPTSTNGAQVRASEYAVIAERPILTVEVPGTSCLSDIDCDDGVFCNGLETCNTGTNLCQGGAPVNCDDSDLCTIDSCDEGLAGTCQNVPVDCSANGDQCNAGICNPSTGQCESQPANEGLGCDDLDDCTLGDVCTGGVCGGIPLDCNDGTACTDEMCVAGSCVYTPSGTCSISGDVLYYRDSTAGGFEPSTKGVPNVDIDVDQDAVADATSASSGNYVVGAAGSPVLVRAMDKLGGTSISDHNGSISSFDATFIAQHAVGIGAPLSANQLVAGDVSGNGTVTSFDAAQVAQFAVGMLPGNHFPVAITRGSDWAFLRCDNYVDASNQDCGAPAYPHDPLSASEPDDDFHAVLYGDVTGNWEAAGAMQAGSAAPEVTSGQDRKFGKRGPDLAQIDAQQIALTFDTDLTAGTGERITAPLSVDDASGILAMDIRVEYDPLVIQAAGVALTSISQGFTLTTNLGSPGVILISLFGVQPMTGTGPILQFDFDVVGSAAQTTPVDLVSAMINEGGIVATLGDGLFVVCDSVDGDGDGVSLCDGDCDDTDNGRFPGNPEIGCDGIDQDCNVVTPDVLDGDGDAFACDVDCNDGNRDIHPGAEEICDGLDNDCNFDVDDAPPPTGVVQVNAADDAGPTFSWLPMATATGYDVLRGRISDLRASGGDFSQASEDCLADDTPDAFVDDTATPQLWDGFWYIIRPTNCGGHGTYDSGGTAQDGPRDAEADASPQSCT